MGAVSIKWIQAVAWANAAVTFGAAVVATWWPRTMTASICVALAWALGTIVFMVWAARGR